MQFITFIPNFCNYFSLQTVVFLTEGAKIFRAPERRVP